jgi:hypothetical protein
MNKSVKKRNDNKLILTVPDKEYQILVFAAKHQSGTYKVFQLMVEALNDGTWKFLDLPGIRSTIIACFDCLRIQERYDFLLNESKDTLSYDKDGFYLNKEHKFETLDEVKRALENKAFL